MAKIATFGSTTIEFDAELGLVELAEARQVDALIIGSEDGFTPLGRFRTFIAEDLGIPEAEIRKLANWIHHESLRTTLVALKSRRQGSVLRGVIIAPCATSRCYQKRDLAETEKPNLDFYFRVTFMAIHHACEEWTAFKIGITHLSASGAFHSDIANTQAIALREYGYSFDPDPPESLLFFGCCMNESHFRSVDEALYEEDDEDRFDWRLEEEEGSGFKLIHISR